MPKQVLTTDLCNLQSKSEPTVIQSVPSYCNTPDKEQPSDQQEQLKGKWSQFKKGHVWGSKDKNSNKRKTKVNRSNSLLVLQLWQGTDWRRTGHHKIYSHPNNMLMVQKFAIRDCSVLLISQLSILSKSIHRHRGTEAWPANTRVRRKLFVLLDLLSEAFGANVWGIEELF